ncbi:putative phenylalanine ammonia-lyase [Corynespora cassiicola Philippines]|uniref:Putative phenylalanine ammonia-lyase n=1 Tax=Corynespora cassiicola Philippines TaxID=1448308 RepID=A0A2T2N1T6_CORCC|nr:putative phenylalanine ammonia-lyase [Corynespora cassiicola Philippines]
MPALDVNSAHDATFSSNCGSISSLKSRGDSHLRNGRLRLPIEIDGESLKIADVIEVCVNGAPAALAQDEATVQKVQASLDCLDEHLRSGKTIYGVNTGFGGSADTRTSEFEELQIALQQHLNVGILVPSDKGASSRDRDHETTNGVRGHALPVPVVRAMMLIRCNSLMRGHSGVRLSTVDAIVTLLKHDITPVVPLRGSISASGDLSSLSYIAGAIEGNPDVFVRIGAADAISADRALKQVGLQPTRLRAKEGLGIMNGTATSCGAACVAIHQAQQMATLSHALTAMGTEALLGTADNYHPFISTCRPHTGQTNAAATILAMLSGSRLASRNDPHKVGLAQDRYALRTAPQWIGPQLEDLELAARQVQAEINSTTDNPLIDAESGKIHHGGNFQAAAVTSAMEKTTSAMQMIGKLLYAQCSELINNQLNKGLPPNLSADDPSLSFTFKGFDVNMAAYMSELAYLAHPVSAHVHVSEMNNQSVNSLALVAARYALEAIEVVSLMAATYIYALCQALDLRSMHLEFTEAAEAKICARVGELFQPAIREEHGDAFAARAWGTLLEKWNGLSHLDLQERGRTAARESVGIIMEHLVACQAAQGMGQVDILGLVGSYQEQAANLLIETYDSTRKEFFKRQTTEGYVCEASKVVYGFVRRDLGVPMHRGLVDHPTLIHRGGADENRPRKILGTFASEIYMALRDGRLHKRVEEMAMRVRDLDADGMHVD